MIKIFKNMSIKAKLFLVISLPLISMILITFITTTSINNIYSNMENKIKNQNYDSISLVLNSDRDLYQSFLALKLLMYESKTPDELKKNKDDILSNMR